MATTTKVLVGSKFAEDEEETQYTATAVKAVIDKFTATNNGELNATISVNLVPSGDSADTDNRIVAIKAIPVGGSYTFPELTGHVLEPGGFISTIASVANTLTIRCSGREIS